MIFEEIEPNILFEANYLASTECGEADVLISDVNFIAKRIIDANNRKEQDKTNVL